MKIKHEKLKRVLFLITHGQHKEISSITYQIRKTKKDYSNSMFVREAVDYWLKKQNRKLEKEKILS